MNNMVGEVLTLPQLGEGVFIWGWKSGRWKQLATKFGHKFGGTEVQDGRSDGQSGRTGRSGGPLECFGPEPNHGPDGQFIARRIGLICRRMVRPGIRPRAGPGAELDIFSGENSTEFLLSIKPRHI
jgi:hypothetical protein